MMKRILFTVMGILFLLLMVSCTTSDPSTFIPDEDNEFSAITDKDFSEEADLASDETADETADENADIDSAGTAEETPEGDDSDISGNEGTEATPDEDTSCKTADLKCVGTEIWLCNNNSWSKTKDCKDESKECFANGMGGATCKKIANDADIAAGDIDNPVTTDETPDIIDSDIAVPDTADNDVAVVPDVDTVQPCTNIVPSAFAKGSSSGQVAWAPYTPGTGSSLADQVQAQIFSTSTGAFALGAGNNANYSSCDQCVIIYEDISGTTFTKAYFATSGVFSVDAVNSSLSYDIGTGKWTTIVNGYKGSLTTVKLVEVTIDSTTLVSTPVANGKCITIDSASWDTQ